jgi:hypothetical protein
VLLSQGFQSHKDLVFSRVQKKASKGISARTQTWSNCLL